MAGAFVFIFIYAGNKMIAEETDGVVKYYHSDQLGSTRMVTDAAGSKVAEYKFKAYGEQESYSGSFSTEYQFTGKPGNDEVGLSYFGARFYDPETGRFLTADTYTNLPNDERILLGTGDSKRILATGFSNSSYYNRYAYCLNNPLGNVDPDGHLVPALIAAGIIIAPYVMAELPSIILFVNRYGPLALDLIEKGSVALCFTEDTPVYIKDRYKFIKDIKVGDDVYSENPETGEKGLKKVVQVFVNETQTLVHIFAGNAEIKATPSHPFWVVGKGWIDAGKLIIGDNLLLYSGEVAKVTAINIEQLLEPIKVYNFEVEDWHTYFVSKNSILVHNTCGGITINEKNINHIFRDASGHFENDTSENRKALLNTANNDANYLGTDKYGNQWYAKTNSDGTQTWAEVRNGQIINGGINETPRDYNSYTGLSSPSK